MEYVLYQRSPGPGAQQRAPKRKALQSALDEVVMEGATSEHDEAMRGAHDASVEIL